MIFGKIIAGLLGYLFAGPVGAAVGVFIGHTFDKGLAGNFQMASPARLAETRQVFFETTFLLMGALAKADGRVCEDEIQSAEQIMTKMGVQGSQRQQAVVFFKRGSSTDFKLSETMVRFNELCGRHQNLKQTLLVFLITLSLADGEMHPAEQQLMFEVAQLLGFSAQQFEHLLGMINAQHSFSGHRRSGGAEQQYQQNDVEAAYKALGVSSDISDKELKRAYRKLMSQHHPDKLIAQGVPDEMLKVATEKSQEIQVAYDLIKKYRK